MTTDDSYSLMIHGGAGSLDELRDPVVVDGYRHSLRRVLDEGRTMLRAGASAVDTVETCAALLEDDPLFNAGMGSVLNEEGRAEMDAAIMDGNGLAAGAVAGIHNIPNPVRLARRVMSDTAQVLLIGEGAMRLAERLGLPRLPDEAFRLAQRVEQLERARHAGEVRLDHDAPDAGRYGTIGAVARDRSGHLAAATSTGGMSNKPLGRVGDSPLIGAGVYADDESCAVSATGDGEDFIRCVMAKTVADAMAMLGLDVVAATRFGMDYLHRRVRGLGGVIVIDRDGRCASGHTTSHLIHGWIEHGGPTQARLRTG